MARIRTIKPDFWTDESIVELTPMARLFFIGMWNFADDHGGIERGARQLKMKILPGDDVDAEALIQELLRSGMLIEYEAAGAPYLNIKNFLRHQRINRPSPQRIPPFKESTQFTESSVSTHGGLMVDSCPEGKGREVEGKGMEGRGRDSVPSERAALRADESDNPSLGATIPGTNEPNQQGDADFDIEQTIRAVLAKSEASPVPAGGRVHPQHPNVIFMRTPRFDD